jgi:DNA helicase II / ATP-dependent DNA helicase PcrA
MLVMDTVIEQQKIINSNAQVVLVDALAGTGKTTVLALTAKQCLEQKLRSEEFLALCFTNGGAAAYRRQFKELKLAETLSDKIYVFPWFARAQFFRLMGSNPIILRSEELKEKILEAAESFYLSRNRLPSNENDWFEYTFDRQETIDQFVIYMKLMKANLLPIEPDESEPQFDAMSINFPKEFAGVLTHYERARLGNGDEIEWQSEVDFVPDLITLLRDNPNLINAFDQYRLVLIDEWHDVNLAEFELIKIVFSNCKLRIVGDQNQAISVERGGGIEAFWLNQFSEAFPHCQHLKLLKSRRFGSSVASLVNSIVDVNCSSIFGKERTTVTRIDYEANCAVAVRSQIELLLSKIQGNSADQICIVLRSEDHSVSIENELLKSGIAYQFNGHKEYYFRPEIGFLRIVLHLISGDYATLEPSERASDVQREFREELLNSLTLGLSRYLRMDLTDQAYASIDDPSENLEINKSKLYAKRKKELLDQISKFPLYFTKMFKVNTSKETIARSTPEQGQWLTKLAGAVEKAYKKLRSTATPSVTTFEVLNEFVNEIDLPAATRRIFLNTGEAFTTQETINNFLQYVKEQGNITPSEFLVNWQKMLNQAQVKQDKIGRLTNRKIRLSTPDFAKGNEYDHILIPFLEKNKFPLNAMASSLTLAQERKLFYVMVTRTRLNLVLFSPKSEALRTEAILRKPNTSNI